MSRASAAVRFLSDDDLDVRYGLYDGTSDILYASLHDTLTEAWAGKNFNRDGSVDPTLSPDMTVYDVEIATDYGAGFWWHGKATRNEVLIESRCIDLGEIETFEGTPPWWGQAMREAEPQ